jgi:catechol 2,3-dioxygenase-like lactoylglutathione lyase family enzyme
MRLDNIRLLVTRFEDCFHFYRDVLGLRLTWGEASGHFASFTFDGGGSGLALFRRGLMATAVGTDRLPEDALAQDRAAVVLQVDSVDDLSRALEARGGPLVSPPRDLPDWGLRAAHLRDPDGNLLELYEELPKAQWTERLKADDARLDRSAEPGR